MTFRTVNPAIRRKSIRIGIVFRHALASLLIALTAYACIARAAKDEVTLNFVNTDIEAVAAAVGQITKRNFLIDPRVKGGGTSAPRTV